MARESIHLDPRSESFLRRKKVHLDNMLALIKTKLFEMIDKGGRNALLDVNKFRHLSTTNSSRILGLEICDVYVKLPNDLDDLSELPNLLKLIALFNQDHL